MKKIAIVCLAFLAMGLVSCNTKSCRCYDFVNGRWTGPHTAYTSPSYSCASLNTRTYFCNEMDDPILNPDEIGIDSKKKK